MEGGGAQLLDEFDHLADGLGLGCVIGKADAKALLEREHHLEQGERVHAELVEAGFGRQFAERVIDPLLQEIPDRDERFQVGHHAPRIKKIRAFARVKYHSGMLSRVRQLFVLKTAGALAFVALFFTAYFLLLRHPLFPIRLVPRTYADSLVPFLPAALPVYCSLWVYVSLPVLLMTTQSEILGFGRNLALLCGAGLLVFLLWPTAVPPADVDWTAYPSMAFLKNTDTSGNACPSLHVASAVFALASLDGILAALDAGRVARAASALWCVAIVVSTMAIRQHVALDVFAGAALGLLFALPERRRAFAGIQAAQRNGTP